MATTYLLCTDGSPLANEALSAGLALLQEADRVIVATVVEGPDPTLVTGASGHAGAVVSPEEFAEQETAAVAEGERSLAEAVSALGLEGAETLTLNGAPGTSICAFAVEVGASAIVMGPRGRGGFKRAMLGSVSDHVLRNAPCPVVITSAS